MSSRSPDGAARCQIRLSPWVLPVLAGALCLGLFPLWCMGVLAVASHELCHALAAWRMGFTVRRLELLPLGAAAQIDTLFETDPICEVGIALAGPMGNLLMVSLLASIPYFWPVENPWLAWAITANLSVALCNLIPALPLDGGRVLRGILAARMEIGRATRIAAGVSLGIGLAVTIAALVMLVAGSFHVTAWFLGIFLLANGWKERKTAPLLTLRQRTGKKEELLRKGSMPLHRMAARYDYPLTSLLRRLRTGRYHLVTVVDGDGQSLGEVSEASVVDCLLAGEGKCVAEALDYQRRSRQEG